LIDALSIARCGFVHNRSLLKAGYRSCFCHTPEQWHRFDVLFDAFWSHLQDVAEIRSQSGSGNSKQNSSMLSGEQRLLGMGGTSEKQAQEETVYGAGDYKALSLADFRFVFDPLQMQHIEKLVEALARRIRRHYFRREISSSKGYRIDPGRSLHRSIRTQGHVLELRYRRRKKRLPRVVLLLDISQSMEIYAKLFLRFTRQLMTVFNQSAAFAFTTELVALGEGHRRLQERDFEAMLSEMSKGWLGGTKIALSLQNFNENHLRNLVNHRTTIIIFSDGCDTARPEQLAEQIAIMQRRAKKLIWVNPLLGRFESGEKDRYMDPVVPFVDVYRSAHNLQSLQALEADLLG
jgi:uncharacterized protein with von Willebrand factor type A (vWA) domain